jgi:hypothetical protein
MVYLDGIQHFYQFNLVSGHFHRKIWIVRVLRNAIKNW